VATVKRWLLFSSIPPFFSPDPKDLSERRPSGILGEAGVAPPPLTNPLVGKQFALPFPG